MISTAANRATFIDSAKKFIADYKIAGIDIDFEYPASTERNGPPTDTPNLTIFFNEMRAGLGSSLITLATPAGYWFLKGFEMDKISTKLDFINMMSYDYRKWDTFVEGANSTAQPQSSLLDMVDSTLLYVKAGVDMKKVNLGLAWYGRTFKLEDKTCGVLANFEIDNIIMDADVRPVYHKDSETRWFTHKGDLITFDDEGTWKAKTDFAKKTCFGGTMIWSIDQEIPKCKSTFATFT
ncbi:glycoside hydrolase [Collybia nuda]|uniref:Glycoside hydrolase n=1 Tax=Collybia nuda TaxID=64659 RepID=A0A9P5Y3B7_9AGAR|nr:glycoside hydrolase [Collybia nuda]